MKTSDIAKMEFYEGDGNAGDGFKRHPPKHKTDAALDRRKAGKPKKRKNDTKANVYF